MKKILPLLAFAVLLLTCGCSAARHASSSTETKTSSSEEFTVSYAGSGTDESVLLKVVCTVSGTDEAVEAVSKYAVMGLMYKGCSATLTSPEVSPLIKMGTELTSEHTAWLTKFFANGGYKKFVLSVAKSSMQITKVKKQYSVEAVVSVDKRRLRKALEDEGIVRRLDAVFGR